jgi:transposase
MAVGELVGREAELRPDDTPKVNVNGIEELVADKGYHSSAVVKWVKSYEVRSYISEKLQKGQRNWQGKAEEQRAVTPGIYFRSLLIGYFEGIGAERGIAWRLADSLALRRFVGIALDEYTPDHSTISRTRRLIDLDTHREVFSWVLKVLADRGLLNGKRIAIDATIATAGPGHCCLECQGVYTQEEATAARESAVWGRYLDVADGNADRKKALRAPSVICNNGLVASLIGLRLLAVALGLTPKTVAGLQRYYIEEGVLGWGSIKECAPGCSKASWIGRGLGGAMKTYDNKGNLLNEQNVIFSDDGKVTQTNTTYDTHTGRVAFQNVSERDSQGNVKTTNTLNGKIRP